VRMATWLLVTGCALLLGVWSLALLRLALRLLLVLGERSRARRLSGASVVGIEVGAALGLTYVWVVLGSLVLVWGGEGLRKVSGIGRRSVGRIQTWLLLRVLLLERSLVGVFLLASVH
jgi:hypothetical protein